MDSAKQLQDALQALHPSLCSYQEWIEVGMALKAEGYPCSTWDEWSSRDSSKYHQGECEKKWNSFRDSGVTIATVFHLAMTLSGYDPDCTLDWNDGLSAYADEVLAVEAKPDEKPYQMAVRFLETIYNSGEDVSYVHSAVYKEERDKWIPADGGHVRKRDDLIKDLKRYRDLDKAFGTIKEEAGAWIRINPTSGPSDKSVTRFAYSLVESDNLSLEEQQKMLINFKLPIATLVESGGKSVHALVKVDAKDEVEYKQRVAFLYDWLAKHNFVVDENNKNPARLSRLPGAMRNGNIQKLIATNIGCASWLEWIDYIEGVDDDLPPTKSLKEQVKNPPQASPELISGILREGCKMIITGESKAGKTCLSQNLAVCIAEGLPWLGKFSCEQGKVLYINLEVEEASLYQRFRAMYRAMDVKMTSKGGENIVAWNLRGHAAPMEKLSKKIVRRCRNTGPYKAIILDPLYKVQQGDENSAEAIIKFTNALDDIAHQTGAAIIYDHHHPKGTTGDRKAIDRGSGSGVFARDADAICDLSFLSPGKEIMELITSHTENGEKPMQIEFVLRDFKDIPPINIWFSFPLHFVDTANLLEGAPVEGSREANLQMSEKRTSVSERKRVLEEAYKACEENGEAKLVEMTEWACVSDRSLRRYIKEFTDEYELVKGIVKKIDR